MTRGRHIEGRGGRCLGTLGSSLISCAVANFVVSLAPNPFVLTRWMLLLLLLLFFFFSRRSLLHLVVVVLLLTRKSPPRQFITVVVPSAASVGGSMQLPCQLLTRRSVARRAFVRVGSA